MVEEFGSCASGSYAEEVVGEDQEESDRCDTKGHWTA